MWSAGPLNGFQRVPLTINSGTLQKAETVRPRSIETPMKRIMVGVALTVALLCGSRVSAHHSFTSTYVENQRVSIQGEVVQFVYRNPHALVQVMAPDRNRQLQRWTIEWEGRGQLDHEGVTGMTLKVGDQVVVTGNPGRNASDHWLRAQTISRPKDGWKWSLGSPSMR